MTDIASYPYGWESAEQIEAVSSQWIARPLARSRATPLLFILPTFVCWCSWMANGAPFLTDMGFVLLSLGCALGVLFELRAFSSRFGVGGLVLFGGVLIWYCHDYFTHWFMADFQNGTMPYPAVVIAKAAFFTSLFTLFGSIGLLFYVPRRLANLTQLIPEPPAGSVYVFVIVLTFLIGVSPYFFFTRESFFTSIWKAMTAMRSANNVEFTVGRTGNLNYNWGGYLAQLIQIGQVGGVLAVFYFVMVPGKGPGKLIALLDWLFWSAMGFGAGGRGGLLFIVLPAAAIVFVKYMTVAANYLRRISKRAIVYTTVLLFVTLVLVQIQGYFRDVGLSGTTFSNFDIFKNQGNSMFSEGLLGYSEFPERRPFASDSFPGAIFVRPIPDLVVKFSISWIPRVLWKNKPGLDEAAIWYNTTVSGGSAVNDASGNQVGATITPSIAAIAYLNYGWPGVVEIGLLFGWLCALMDRSMFLCLARPFALMFTLSVMAWLFRGFRILTPHDLYPVFIGTFCGSVMIIGIRMFMGDSYGNGAAEPSQYS